MFTLPALFSFTFLLIAILGLEAASISISNRALESITINKDDYKLTPIAEGDQGGESTTYDMNDGFDGQPAILKLIRKKKTPPPGELEKIEKEVRFAKEVGQTLYYSATDNPRYYVFVVRNIRTGYPTKDSPERKFAHEWYLQDEELEAKEVVDVMRTNMFKRSRRYAKENGLMYGDLHLRNALVDSTFEDMEFIDWAPGYTDEPDSEDSDGPDEVAGVEEVSKDATVAARQIAEFEKEARETLERNVNLAEFQEILEGHGKSLRPKDMQALEEEKANIA